MRTRARTKTAPASVAAIRQKHHSQQEEKIEPPLPVTAPTPLLPCGEFAVPRYFYLILSRYRARVILWYRRLESTLPTPGRTSSKFLRHSHRHIFKRRRSYTSRESPVSCRLSSPRSPTVTGLSCSRRYVFIFPSLDLSYMVIGEPVVSDLNSMIPADIRGEKTFQCFKHRTSRGFTSSRFSKHTSIYIFIYTLVRSVVISMLGAGAISLQIEICVRTLAADF